jgi:hypothetical protein
MNVGGIKVTTHVFKSLEEYKRINKKNSDVPYSISIESGNFFSIQSFFKKEDFYIAAITFVYKIPKRFWVNSKDNPELNENRYKEFNVLKVYSKYGNGNMLIDYDCYSNRRKILYVYVPNTVERTTEKIVEYFLNELKMYTYIANNSTDIFNLSEAICRVPKIKNQSLLLKSMFGTDTFTFVKTFTAYYNYLIKIVLKLKHNEYISPDGDNYNDLYKKLLNEL